MPTRTMALASTLRVTTYTTLCAHDYFTGDYVTLNNACEAEERLGGVGRRLCRPTHLRLHQS